jgi:hypothetical protein
MMTMIKHEKAQIGCQDHDQFCTVISDQGTDIGDLVVQAEFLYETFCLKCRDSPCASMDDTLIQTLHTSIQCVTDTSVPESIHHRSV